MATYYLLVEDQQVGPLTEGQVQQMASLGTVTEETPAWKEGRESWSTVKDLGLSIAPSVTPPEPVSANRTPPVSESEPSPSRLGWGERCKALLGVLIFLPVTYGILVYSLHLPTLIRLAHSKQAIMAKVVAYEPSTYTRRGISTTTHWHRVEIEGQKILVDLGNPHPLGAEVSMVYLPGDPQTAMMGNGNESFSQLVEKNAGWPLFLGVGGIAAMFGLLSVAGLFVGLTGRRLAGGRPSAAE